MGIIEGLLCERWWMIAPACSEKSQSSYIRCAVWGLKYSIARMPYCFWSNMNLWFEIAREKVCHCGYTNAGTFYSNTLISAITKPRSSFIFSRVLKQCKLIQTSNLLIADEGQKVEVQYCTILVDLDSTWFFCHFEKSQKIGKIKNKLNPGSEKNGCDVWHPNQSK